MISRHRVSLVFVIVLGLVSVAAGGFSDISSWSTYDPDSYVGKKPAGYDRAVFDGRYIYFVPYFNGDEHHGEVLRYDTERDFNSVSSWIAYDPNAFGLGNDLDGYCGGVFDGRYVYFAPYYNGSNYHGEVMRYDTHGVFYDISSWAAYDSGLGDGYAGAIFDGRYVYFVPGYDGKVLRYDTDANFTSASSWAAYSPGTGDRYDGGVYDGQYIYFAPASRNGKVLRYDTNETFNTPSSWTTFDPNGQSVVTKSYEYFDAVFDGRYVYFVPYYNGEVLRYDTSANFSNASSWQAYDPVAGFAYAGGVFDGQYIYFAPVHDGWAADGEVLRYDTSAAFTAPGSWSRFDPGSQGLGNDPDGYYGAVRAGKYIYFVPYHNGSKYHSEVLRYDIGIAICPDFDDDGDIDFTDFAFFASCWRQDGLGGCGGADCTTDGEVDFKDLCEFASHWLEVAVEPLPSASAGGPTGYAAMDGKCFQYLPGGTIGGAGGTVVTVTDINGLIYYAGQTEPYIIQVRGAIVSPTLGDVNVQSNKTIIGIGNDAAIVGHGLDMKDVNNIIIKNLTIKDNYIMGDWPGKLPENDKDDIALRNTHHVWIDHCHLQRAGDGLCDLSHATGYVTVSWTIYSHNNKATLSDGEAGSIAQYTFDHCWFTNTNQRNVSASYADIHAFNCYHTGVQSYCMNARVETRILLQNMYFKQSNDPYYPIDGGEIQADWCILDGTTGVAIANGTDLVPPYAYKLDNTPNVPAIVMAGAGPGGYLNTAASPVIFVDFEPNTSWGVYGYLPDYGYVYGDRGNGYSYGWNEDNSSNAFWRLTISTKDETSLVPVDTDYRRNSIITTADGARYWEIGLDNGMYYVHLMCGEPGDPRNLYDPSANVLRNNTMNIEGTIVTDPDGALNSDYDEYYAVVNVTDGNLTISQAPGGDDSAVCFVDIHPARSPENPSGTVNGLDYKYYEGDYSFTPDFDSLTSVGGGTAANFDISSPPSTDGFGFVFEGYLDVPSDGLYTFYTSSDDGSKLYIGSTEVVDNDGTHEMQEASGQILLKAGKHAIKVTMFDRTGSEGLEVSWEGPSISKQLIPSGPSGKLYRIP